MEVDGLVGGEEETSDGGKSYVPAMDNCGACHTGGDLIPASGHNARRASDGAKKRQRSSSPEFYQGAGHPKARPLEKKRARISIGCLPSVCIYDEVYY